MKFTDMIKVKSKETKNSEVSLDKKQLIFEANSEPEDVLRNNKIKIKLVTDTAFGKQIDLFKEPDKEEIQKILKGFNIKFKGKSVFIVY